MEEQVKDEAAVEVEVVEKKKGFFTKKKILAIGGTVLGLAVAGAVALKKGKDHESEGEEILKVLETTYEPVTEVVEYNSEVVE